MGNPARPGVAGRHAWPASAQPSRPSATTRSSQGARKRNRSTGGGAAQWRRRGQPPGEPAAGAAATATAASPRTRAPHRPCPPSLQAAEGGGGACPAVTAGRRPPAANVAARPPRARARPETVDDGVQASGGEEGGRPTFLAPPSLPIEHAQALAAAASRGHGSRGGRSHPRGPPRRSVATLRRARSRWVVRVATAPHNLSHGRSGAGCGASRPNDTSHTTRPDQQARWTPPPLPLRRT